MPVAIVPVAIVAFPYTLHPTPYTLHPTPYSPFPVPCSPFPVPRSACLHQGTERHAALASDLIEEFRAPMVDALVMWLVNRRQVDKTNDFLYKNSGCYLNDSGRRKFLKAFVQRMEETITNEAGEVQPKWDLLTQQVKKYKQFVYQPTELYSPYQIR